MKKKSFPVTNIGTASLMLIFIVLCMVTFALLSLSSAIGDARPAEKVAEHTREYYTASNRAEELLAAADAVFAGAFESAGSETEYRRQISEELPAPMEADLSDNGFEISFQVPMSDSQALLVRLLVFSPEQIRSEGTDAFYRICAWQEINTVPWEGDNTLHLFQPEQTAGN